MSDFFDVIKSMAAEGEQEAKQLAKIYGKEPGALDAVRPERLAIDVFIGKTHYVYNSIDAEIVKNLPQVVAKAVLEQPDNYCHLWRIIHPGHVKVWLRELEIHPDIGRWTYIEACIPPKLLVFPESKSVRAFRRGVTLAYSLMSRVHPGHDELFREEIEKLLDPKTKWIIQEDVWKAPTMPRPPGKKKLTRLQLFLDLIEYTGNHKQLGGGQMMLRELGPVLASMRLKADAHKEMTPEDYAREFEQMKREAPAFWKAIENIPIGVAEALIAKAKSESPSAGNN
jgi:hypothetical protein